ncbi:hypothetical protein GW17_00055957 [Ensete ventricosum]|nr:hypothetical protein GW17_00055957 [Ensete ventricosum]
MDLGSSLGIEPRFRRCGGSSSVVHLNFTEGIGKIARNMLGDHRRRTVRLVVRNARSCQIVGVRSLSLVGPSEGDVWPMRFPIGCGARSIMMSYPTFWASEAPTGARVDVFRLLTLYSCSVEVLAHRSWALGCPSGDPKSTVVPSSSAPNDSGDGKALATMRSCFNIDSTVTARRLIDVRKDCYVPPEYELHVPLPGQHPYDVFPSGFGLSTNALEVGLSFPLHPVIEACLEGWQI